VFVPRFIPPTPYHVVTYQDRKRLALSKKAFETFNVDVLDLGNVSALATPTEAIAAVFDLEAFTNFCKQIEPHLSVPKYLNSFLTWLMEQLRDEMREANHGTDAVLWSPLPFFVKFLGDGLLILWDSADMSDATERNVILSMFIICDRYKQQFLPTLRSKIVEPPSMLRCGVARGTVLSVGEGRDYVGSCINMAARIQKLPGISFCFNRRGFDIEDPRCVKFFTEQIVIREVSIRGIGDHELVCILKSEAKKFTAKERKIFRELK
jgi:class 3 adenylate cyclase